VTAPYERAGFATDYAYKKARRQAKDWSDAHSRVDASKYKSGMSPETFRAYFDAFASFATGTTARRKRAGRSARKHLGPSRYVRKYMVNTIHHYSASEFDEIYAGLE